MLVRRLVGLPILSIFSRLFDGYIQNSDFLVPFVLHLFNFWVTIALFCVLIL